MPRWKENDERGEFGAWLSDEVGDRTFDWLAAEMAARGHHHGASYYRAMASGAKPPGRVIRRALREFFGAPAEGPSGHGTAPSGVEAVVAAIGELVGEMRAERLARGVAIDMPDEAEQRRRRAYWIERATRGVNFPEVMRRAEQPAGQDKELRAWTKGELPKGANLARFARAVNLPIHVLTDPPATDDERLVIFRREAIAELPQLQRAEPERRRRAG